MRKPKNWTKRDAEAFLIQMLYLIGPNFNPCDDTHEIESMDGNPFFSPDEATGTRLGIDAACALFPDDEVELYQFLSEWQEKIYPGSTPNGGEQTQSVTLLFGRDDRRTYTFSTNKDANEALAMIEDVAESPYSWEQID